ncbi:MAG: CHASE domain-containing protein [Dechloromonas sp.]|nr:CHASE domain-containing protein [Dechloromonas sp.]
MILRYLLSAEGETQGRRRAALGAAIAGLLIAILTGIIVFGIRSTAHHQHEILARQLATAVAHDLGGRLDRSLSAAIALGAVLRQGGGKVDHFKRLAGELINQFGGISALQLAPAGTISAVEPLAGNERVIGFSPLNDPLQGPEARQVVAQRQLGLSGPFELRQGGVGVVGRNPVFLRDGEGKEVFWGLVQVLIRMPDLLVTTRLDAIEEAGYRYELWRYRPGSTERYVFARSSDQPLVQPVNIPIAVPNGEWVLSVAPDAGWHSLEDSLIDGAVVLLIALLGGVAAYLGLRQVQLLSRQARRQSAS